MALTKGFFIKEANFASCSLSLGSQVFTTFTVKGPMSRSIAQAMGIKDRIYPDAQSDGAAVVKETKLEDDLIGPTVNIRPVQGNLTKEIKETTLPVLKISGINIKTHQDDNQMLITLTCTIQDQDSEFDSLIKSMAKDKFDFDVRPGNKTAIAQASAQLSLKPAEEEESGEEEESDDKGDDAKPTKVRK